MDLAELIPVAIKASIALMVLGLGLRASLEGTRELLVQPGLLLRSLLAMNVIMPLVGAGLAAALALHPVVKVVLVALAVSPVPPLLPRKQFAAGGDRVYATALFVTAAVLAIVFVPAAVALLGRAFGLSVYVPPATVAMLVTITVLAPLAAGLLLQGLAPSLAKRLADPVSKIATGLLLAALVPILIVLVPQAYSLIGRGTLAVLAVFCIVGLVTGHLLGGPVAGDRLTLALATASRHPGVSLAIAIVVFPDHKLAAAAIGLYLVVTAIGSALYLAWFRRRYAATLRGTAADVSKRSAA